ncbi:MAG TPA: ParA family protein [Steroidobacteraceae bacterium]|nr:ParA family protein [Steroidobacteraceae bacterium]
MQRIVVLNPKGGSGKTTLAINLAAYFAGRGDNTLLIDRDPQGSSTRWLRKRKVPQPAINGIATFERDSRTTLSWQMRVPDGTQKIVVDSPAAVEARAMPELVRDAHKVIEPVLPSDIDIHAASRCIADLLLVAKIKRAENRIGVVANRVRKNTLMFQALMRFLEKLDIPVIATIRDSQNYVRAAEQGVGIHEMKSYTVKEDIGQWQTLLAWLEPEKVLTEQPAPIQEQPAPQAVPTATEAAIEPNTDETGVHDARFMVNAS